MSQANRKGNNFFPLLGKKYEAEDYLHMDLSTANESLNGVNDQSDLAKYISIFTKDNDEKIPFGGYGEKRNLYQSGLFKSSEEPRNIHLGIDIWHKENTPLYAPLNGEVAYVQYNDNGLDYGHTLIIRAGKEYGKHIYMLFGHLSNSVWTLITQGHSVKQGQLIAHIGDMHENGGWVPHVHFQLIHDLQGNKGDYPGVCKESEKDFYLNNCPDPTRIILP